MGCFAGAGDVEVRADAPDIGLRIAPGATPVTQAADPELLRAVRYALTGQWQAAHEIVQAREGEAIADWIHGVVHRIEGDLSNARYWYGKSGRTLPGAETVDEELQAIRASIEGAASPSGADGVAAEPRP